VLPRFGRQGLPWTEPVVWMPALAVLGIGVGFVASGWAWVVPMILLCSLAWYRPEVTFALFLTVGAYKSNPLVSGLFPMDATVVLALALMVAILGSFRVGSPHPPTAAILLLPVLVLTGLGTWGAAGDYGTAKALRFVTLTALAILACMTLLVRRDDLTRFLATLALVAAAVTVAAALGNQTDSTARLRLDGSSPITLARMSVITLTGCWLTLRQIHRRWPWLVLVPLALVAVYVATATGSRGPVFSGVAGVLVLEFFARRSHKSSLLPIRWLAGLMVAVSVLVLSGVVPADPLLRFQHALLFEGDRSISQRQVLFESAWLLLRSHPFGIGVGGFADHAILSLRYPHNVFLETGVELGWVPMLCLAALAGWSFWTLFGALRRSIDWTTCLLVMIVLMSGINSMVTGDLNDNRMFFALVLVPFLYRDALQGEARGQGATPTPDERHAIHLASSP